METKILSALTFHMNGTSILYLHKNLDMKTK